MARYVVGSTYSLGDIPTGSGQSSAIDGQVRCQNARGARRRSFGRRFEEGVEFGDDGERGADGCNGFAKLLNLRGFHVT